jgi:hypothetical protein
MRSEYDALMREYQVPPGVLSEEELKMLKDGGIRLEDSDEEDYQQVHRPLNRQTQPKIPKPHSSSNEAESLRQIFQEQLSLKDKQIHYLQNELVMRDQVMEAERRRL